MKFVVDMEKVHSRIGPCHPQCSRVACAQRRPVVLGSRNRQKFIILKQISRVDAGVVTKLGRWGDNHIDEREPPIYSRYVSELF